MPGAGLCAGWITCTNALDADPLLGPLQDNGGFTETMALGAGSPAIDATACLGGVTSDQRGVPRPQGANCDMGAYEVEHSTAFSAVPAPPGPLAFFAPTGQTDQLTIDISNTGDPGSLLDVSLASISANYSIVSGLPIDDLTTTGGPVTVIVQCNSAPQAAGTLVLTTNDRFQPTVTYNLTCTALEPEFSASSAPGSTLAFIAPTGQSDQLAVDVSNSGDPGSLLDVSLGSIDSGYSVLAGLPVTGLATTDSPVLLVVRCDSAPTAPGTLVLNTNDPALPTVTYDLTCTALESQFVGAPAPPGPLDFAGLPASSPQLTIQVSNGGVAGSELDVSLASISANYSIVSGLPIDDLGSAATPVDIIVRCDSAPQPAGTLVLNTNDPALPTVTYDLSCTALESQFAGAPAPPGPLAFSGLPGSSPQLSIEISNTGDAGSQLDVDVLSITPGYSIISGLPIAGLLTTDPAAAILVQCDSVPQAAGVLELITNDPLQSTVTYDLSCSAPLSGGGGGSGLPSAGTDIAPSGTTTLHFGRIWVSVPASAIPPGQSDCRIQIRAVGTSGKYGFSLDDTVWDVKIVCDSGELNLFFDALTVCIRPADGVMSDKNVYHRHSAAQGFGLISGGSGPAGYVCGQTRVLSLFTLGQLSLPATGFAPGLVTELAAQGQAYTNSGLSLSIPKLGVEMDILGVPQGPNGWDVTWLASDQAGYLYGTAFPTWQGNSVLTAHVWNADNTPGPFHALKNLQHGDRFTIQAYGYTYTYEVRSNRLVSESNLNVLADSKYSQITLLTCETFSESRGGYLYRRAVGAVLVAVE